MLKRIKIVTSLVLVLVLFGLLQLASGGLFFNSLKHDKEDLTILQTVRQQQSWLNGSWVALLQTHNTLNRAGIRYMMDQNNIGSGATVAELMQIATKSLSDAEKRWTEYEAMPRDPRQSEAAALEIKRNYDIYHGALSELYFPTKDEMENQQGVPVDGTYTDGQANNSEQSQKIDINTADKEQLMTLSGIGEAKAESIIRYRAEHGNFAQIEDITNVDGIGESLFQKIKEYIYVK